MKPAAPLPTFVRYVTVEKGDPTKEPQSFHTSRPEAQDHITALNAKDRLRVRRARVQVFHT